MTSLGLATSSPRFLRDMRQAPRRDLRGLVFSIVAHLAVLLLISIANKVAEGAPTLVEISWLEAAPAASSASAVVKAAEPARETKVETSSEQKRDVAFQRELKRAQLEPVPQRPDALNDALSQKLATIPNAKPSARPELAVQVPTTSWQKQPALQGSGVPSAARQSLSRAEDTSTGTSSQALRRESGKAAMPTQLAGVPTSAATSLAPVFAEPDENSARRTVDGAQLIGPVADRPVLAHRLPEYPGWAMRDAVEASVTLYFIVLANGDVKSNMLVQQTSGHADFDQNAKTALSRWKFEAIRGVGEQWGTITFHFRLRDR